MDRGALILDQHSSKALYEYGPRALFFQSIWQVLLNEGVFVRFKSPYKLKRSEERICLCQSSGGTDPMMQTWAVIRWKAMVWPTPGHNRSLVIGYCIPLTIQTTTQPWRKDLLFNSPLLFWEGKGNKAKGHVSCLMQYDWWRFSLRLCHRTSQEGIMIWNS